MEIYKVMFKNFHIGTLTVTQGGHSYVANKEVIEEIKDRFPIFDILKEDVSATNIPFFKVRLENKGQTFETDEYEIVLVK